MIRTKQQCRELFLQKRTYLSPGDHERMTKLIAWQLIGILDAHPLGWLHSYVSDGFRNEVNTSLIRSILSTELPLMGSASVCWVAPRIVPGSRMMTHYIWDDDTLFLANRWGIKEPDPVLSQPIDIAEIDAVLVPLLGYDRRGHRVGYGGGYYDRFLAECRADVLKVGLSFFDPVEAISDVGEWDVRMDLCITPSQVYRYTD